MAAAPDYIVSAYEGDNHPFEIVTSNGDRAYADDEFSALVAARTLRADHCEGSVGRSNAPTTYIVYEGQTVLTIAPSQSIPCA